MSNQPTSSLRERYEWLREQSTLFAARTQNYDEQDVATLLSMNAHSTSLLPTQEKPWVPSIDDTQNLEAAQASLRQAKMTGIPYFLWWELGIHGDIETSARHLALWASGLLQSAYKMAEFLMVPRFGRFNEGEAEFAVIGLGKLGGWELNLGSDVDLLFVWDAMDGTVTHGGRNSVPAKEYFQHFSRMFIRLMDEHTIQGQAWLTDMRLRPNGDGSPICLNLEATLNHYQDYGQTWERAMLSKASVVAGSQKLGLKLIEGLRPFIWRQYMDFTTVQALSEMKQRIDKQAENQVLDVGFDVKRGRGGIREIEFMIQSLQLLYAGREHDLAKTPSLLALESLKEHEYISVKHADLLRSAYCFWRRVEHAIQAQRGQHTHKLPQDWENWLNLALDLEDIKIEMQQISDAVHNLFQQHFNNIAEADFEHDHTWLESTPAKLLESITDLYPKNSEEEQQKMVHVLQNIQTHIKREVLPERCLSQVEQITSFCLNHWQGDANAVNALQSWSDLLFTIGGRATWIDLLANHEQALQWLANMLASSGFIAKNIAHNPTWLEWPLATFTDEIRIQKICKKIAALETIENEDDTFLANLGRLVDESRLTTAIHIASNDDANPEVVGRWLSDVADQTVLAAMKLALFQNKLPADFPMVALAMGKHGSQAMGLVSDLDMVFVLVHEDPFALGPKDKNYREWAQRVGRRMIQHLSLQPPFGAGFEFDARLRPSGHSGVLVTTLQAFEEYQLTEAHTWEHQALCRARALAFTEAPIHKVNAVIERVLKQARDEHLLKTEVKSMRQKMLEHLSSKSSEIINLKHDEGGLVDIEFLAQYARLCFAIGETSTVATLQNLPSQAPQVWHDYAPFLTESFLVYRQMENALRVQLWASVGRLPANDHASEWETLRRHTPIQNTKALQERMLKVREIFEVLLKE